jgi:hypothetical protein
MKGTYDSCSVYNFRATHTRHSSIVIYVGVDVGGGLVLVVAWCWWWLGVGGGLVLVVGWCWWWVGVGGGLVLVVGWCWWWVGVGMLGVVSSSSWL